MTSDTLRSFREIEVDYFRQHPEEIDDYITELFADYAEYKDVRVLQASVQTIISALKRQD